MKRAIIIGASSGIGRQVAQLLIQDGWHVGLAARRTEKLEQLARIGEERVKTIEMDVNTKEATSRLQTLISQVGGMNLFFYAAGIGKQNPMLEEDIELNTVETNALGFTRMVGEAFRYFAERAGGHIAVISSIAGTKGLSPAPSYSATKAMQNCYLQALDQLAQQRKLNISFTDIRPGFVDTELLFPEKTTENKPETSAYPMLMSAQKVAKLIVKAIYKRKRIAVIDWRWRLLTHLWRWIPNSIWRRIKLIP